MQQKRTEALLKDLSNDIYLVIRIFNYKIFEIFVKNWNFLTLIIHRMEVPLYTNKIYPTLYISLYRSNMAHGG